MSARLRRLRALEHGRHASRAVLEEARADTLASAAAIVASRLNLTYEDAAARVGTVAPQPGLLPHELRAWLFDLIAGRIPLADQGEEASADEHE